MERQSTRDIFSERLLKYRQYLGLSQQRMADRLGVAKTTIINWEKPSGAGHPSWEQLDEMCSWTGIRPIYFFVDEEFGSDAFDLTQQIEALRPPLREAIKQIVENSR